MPPAFHTAASPSASRRKLPRGANVSVSTGLTSANGNGGFHGALNLSNAIMKLSIVRTGAAKSEYPEIVANFKSTSRLVDSPPLCPTRLFVICKGSCVDPAPYINECRNPRSLRYRLMVQSTTKPRLDGGVRVRRRRCPLVLECHRLLSVGTGHFVHGPPRVDELVLSGDSPLDHVPDHLDRRRVARTCRRSAPGSPYRYGLPSLKLSLETRARSRLGSAVSGPPASLSSPTLPWQCRSTEEGRSRRDPSCAPPLGASESNTASSTVVKTATPGQNGQSPTPFPPGGPRCTPVQARFNRGRR